MFDLGAEDINVILSVAPPAQRPPSVHVCLDLFSISLLAGWGAGLDLPRVSTRTGITFPKAVLGCCAENQVKQTQPVFHTDC